MTVQELESLEMDPDANIYPIEMIATGTNRKQSRLVLVEYARHLTPLREIEKLFLDALFYTTYSYEFLWGVFSEQYEKEVNHIKKKVKYISINEDYFKLMYKPQH